MAPFSGSSKAALCAGISGARRPLQFALAVLCLLGVTGTGPAAEGNSPLPDRVLFYDTAYSVVYGGQMAPAVSYFTAQGFALMDTKQLLAWMKQRLDSGTCGDTAVLQISDVTPTSLAEPWDKTCPLYRYCENGGRYVAAGGTPLCLYRDRIKALRAGWWVGEGVHHEDGL